MEKITKTYEKTSISELQRKAGLKHEELKEKLDATKRSVDGRKEDFRRNKNSRDFGNEAWEKNHLKFRKNS